MAKPIAMAIATSRASRQPLFASSPKHKIMHTIEIKPPAGALNSAASPGSLEFFFARQRRIGSAAQVLA
jgi:hypothetical protein